MGMATLKAAPGKRSEDGSDPSLPVQTGDSAHALPPCATAIAATIESPRPMP